jgi:hypothetical protein
VVGTKVKKSKPTEVVAAPRLRPKPQRIVVAVTDPAAVVSVTASKKRVGVANKTKLTKVAPVAVAAAHPVPKPVQRSSMQVAELTSHRKWGMQRSFRGDDWRISVWEPR